VIFFGESWFQPGDAGLMDGYPYRPSLRAGVDGLFYCIPFWEPYTLARPRCTGFPVTGRRWKFVGGAFRFIPSRLTLLAPILPAGGAIRVAVHTVEATRPPRPSFAGTTGWPRSYSCGHGAVCCVGGVTIASGERVDSHAVDRLAGVECRHDEVLCPATIPTCTFFPSSTVIGLNDFHSVPFVLAAP
jgi:hypothetical protein